MAIPAAAGVLAIIFPEWMGGFLCLAVLAFLQALNQANRNKYFITRFELEGDRVTIDYTAKGESKTANGARADFTAKKKAAMFQRGTEAYLAIYRNGRPLVRQYQTPEWQEPSFDAVVTSLGGTPSYGMSLEI